MVSPWFDLWRGDAKCGIEWCRQHGSEVVCTGPPAILK